jgi:hypothetical protein
MKKTFFTFLVLLFTFSLISISIILPGTGYACSCAKPPAVEDEFEQSKAVLQV